MAEHTELELFVSHASEDKDSFVRPLAHYLSDLGVRLWYDEYSLTAGDSLSRSIDLGLARCSYGLVVLSPAFMNKSWTEYELRGLTARELASQGKVLLPVWLDVSAADVLDFSPPLADKLAVRTDGRRVEDVALDILRVVRPSLAEQLGVFLRLSRGRHSASTESVDARDLQPSPVKPMSIEARSVVRVHMIVEVLGNAHPEIIGSVDDFLVSLARDGHPELEIRVWEQIAVSYLKALKANPQLGERQRRELVELLLAASLGQMDTVLSKSGAVGELAAAVAVQSMRWAHELEAKGVVLVDFTRPDPVREDR